MSLKKCPRCGKLPEIHTYESDYPELLHSCGSGSLNDFSISITGQSVMHLGELWTYFILGFEKFTNQHTTANI